MSRVPCPSSMFGTTFTWGLALRGGGRGLAGGQAGGRGLAGGQGGGVASFHWKEQKKHFTDMHREGFEVASRRAAARGTSHNERCGTGSDSPELCSEQEEVWTEGEVSSAEEKILSCLICQLWTQERKIMDVNIYKLKIWM